MTYQSLLVIITLSVAIFADSNDGTKEEETIHSLKSNGGFKPSSAEFSDDNRVFFNQIPGLPVSRYSREDQRRWVDGHNRRRSTEFAANMKKLKWDDNLAQMAQGWAEKCRFEHGHIPSGWESITGWEWVGQNLHVAWPNPKREVELSMKGWYEDEKPHYDFDRLECVQSGSEKVQCGHYTAMAWADTEFVGCAAHLCRNMVVNIRSNQVVNDGWNVVCNYGPGGNIIGQQPYIRGSPCSQCANSHPQCDRGLCAVSVSGGGGNGGGGGGSGGTCSCGDWVDDRCPFPCNVRGSTTSRRSCSGDPQACAREITTRSVSCMTPCAATCDCSQWNSWQQCSAACGQTGIQSRRRNCTPANICQRQEQFQQQSCVTECNPVNCDCREWTLWTQCQADCDQTGRQSRSRTCSPQHLCRNEPTSQRQACVRHCSARSCTCTEWERGPCNSLCTAPLTRRCRPRELCQGAVEVASMGCTGGSCVTRCECDPWSQWRCPASCSQTGRLTRTRNCRPLNQCRSQTTDQGASCRGSCPGDNNSGDQRCRRQNEQYYPCGPCEGTCSNRNPVCTAECRKGECGCIHGFVRGNEGLCILANNCARTLDGDQSCERSGERFYECKPMCDGTCAVPNPACRQSNHQQQQGCTAGSGCACDNDYVRHDGNCIRQQDCDNWEAWNGWSPCSATCSNDSNPPTRTRQRRCVPGRTCTGSTQETEECNLPRCAAGCECGEWQSWGCYSVRCGEEGIRARFRQCSPDDNEQCRQMTSNIEGSCFRDCGNTCSCDEWSDWTCDTECGSGTRTRRRTCGGTNCASEPTEQRGSSCTGTKCTGSDSEWFESICLRVCGLEKYLRYRTQPCTVSNCISPVRLQTKLCEPTPFRSPCIYPCTASGACESNSKD